MSYKIKLSSEDFKYFEFTRGRYEAPTLFVNALCAEDEIAEAITFGKSIDGEGLFSIPEHKAWEINEALEDEGGWTCLDPHSELAEKLNDFINDIV